MADLKRRGLVRSGATAKVRLRAKKTKFNLTASQGQNPALDFYLQVNARIRPGLSYLREIRLTAVPPTHNRPLESKVGCVRTVATQSDRFF